MQDPIAYFITWTTYGTWLPGDARGWRQRGTGDRVPQPLLEDWCRKRMTGPAMTLSPEKRALVEQACREHARIRGWTIHAINPRSNHVHVAITADAEPQIVRDQLKANATRVLREADSRLANAKIWTRGGDCEILFTEDDLEQVILYINDAQDDPRRFQ